MVFLNTQQVYFGLFVDKDGLYVQQISQCHRDGQCRGYIFFDTVQLNYQSQTQANTTRRKVETPQRHFWYTLSQENVSDHSPASVVL